mmetsp:Transcript_25204/g.70452  ORF Transcript_25204/g.70452 Transcript_25204/m.70452 type:complete len:265 (-) Transcript_25204:242-1036(-)
MSEARVLLNVLRHAVGKLLIERREGPHLMQWNQGLEQELLVLVFQRQREAVDNAPQDLQQLADTTVVIGLVDDLEEDVLDGAADERAEGHELAVYSVQDRFEVVPLAGVLGVEELEQLHHEVLVHEALGNLRVHVVGDDEPQEKLVDDLQVRPRALQGGLVLLWVRERPRVLVACLQSSEDVRRHHADDVLHENLVEAVARVVHVLHHLQQRLALGVLLALARLVGEVEDHGTDLHLAAEELAALHGRHLSQLRERREGAGVGR